MKNRRAWISRIFLIFSEDFSHKSIWNLHFHCTENKFQGGTETNLHTYRTYTLPPYQFLFLQRKTYTLTWTQQIWQNLLLVEVDQVHLSVELTSIQKMFGPLLSRRAPVEVKLFKNEVPRQITSPHHWHLLLTSVLRDYPEVAVAYLRHEWYLSENMRITERG